MAVVTIENVKARSLFHWNRGVRQWDDYQGYTIAPSITLGVNYTSIVTMEIEIQIKDALRFEDNRFEKVENLGEFTGIKKFDFEWKVDLFNTDIVQEPTQSSSRKENLPVKPVSYKFTEEKAFKVDEYGLSPRIGIKITLTDSFGQPTLKTFFIDKKKEVFNENAG